MLILSLLGKDLTLRLRGDGKISPLRVCLCLSLDLVGDWCTTDPCFAFLLRLGSVVSDDVLILRELPSTMSSEVVDEETDVTEKSSKECYTISTKSMEIKS